MDLWHWLTTSDAGLAARIAVGAAIFLALALVDLRKNGARATRWREYLVLIACTLAAIAYGALNDQVTSTISWEYFYYGKGLWAQLGPQLPPDPLKLHLAAALVGIKATWTAGLIIGVALLLANNPSTARPRLAYPALFRRLPLIFAITAAVSALGALAGYLGLPARWDDDFADMLRLNEMRPRRFLTVYGIHLGGYAGGALATIAAALSIRRARSRPSGQLILPETLKA